MKAILGYLHQYWKEISKLLFAGISLLAAFAIWCNYRYNLNDTIHALSEEGQLLGWTGVFLLLFGGAYGMVFRTKRLVPPPLFYGLLVVASVLFAWKMSYDFSLPLSQQEAPNKYWNQVFYWPYKVLVVTLTLWLTARVTGEREPLYGWRWSGFAPRPYFLMLLVMVPLIAAASTQPDFLNVYPKLKHLAPPDAEKRVWYAVLYELSYGSDFFTIELFFRGFLVLGFIRFAGKEAILPMAVFYCAIHFGKPLGECISSYFGGILLGVVIYHSRSFVGGLVVHLGIAWLMEIGGYLGGLLTR